MIEGEKILLGRYRCVALLGVGPNGEVWRVHDVINEEERTARSLPEAVSKSGDEMAVVTRICVQVQQLSHPNLVPVLQLQRDPLSQLQYLLCEYADGRNLRDHLGAQPEAVIPIDRAVRIVGEVAKALDHVHANGLVHRALKPENVIIGPQGTVRVTDTCVASVVRGCWWRVAKGGRTPESALQYLAPEQWKGDSPGPAADQYALGILLLELLAGEPPFARVAPKDLERQVLETTIVYPNELDASRRDAVTRALAKRPEDRFPTCGDFVNALDGGTGPPKTDAVPARPPAAPKPKTDRVAPRMEPGEGRAETMAMPVHPTSRLPRPLKTDRMAGPVRKGGLADRLARSEPEPEPPIGEGSLREALSLPDVAPDHTPAFGRPMVTPGSEPSRPEPPPPPPAAPDSPFRPTRPSRTPEVPAPSSLEETTLEPDPDAGFTVDLGEEPEPTPPPAPAASPPATDRTLLPEPSPPREPAPPGARAVERLETPVYGDDEAGGPRLAAGIGVVVVLLLVVGVGVWVARRGTGGPPPTPLETRRGPTLTPSPTPPPEVEPAPAPRVRPAPTSEDPATRLRRSIDRGSMVRVPAGLVRYRPRLQTRDVEARVATLWIDRTEVTADRYRACVDAGGCAATGLDQPAWGAAEDCTWGRLELGDHPLNCLDWEQARSYCLWMGKRLPTEEEWMRAALGGRRRIFPWGNRAPVAGQRVANVADESLRRTAGPLVKDIVSGYDDGFERTAPVGSFPEGKSPFGALDLVGNVAEFTSTQPTPASVVIRGGSWQDALGGAILATPSAASPPTIRSAANGFRCAADG